MTQRLFVYGTLAPGRSNAHMLADLAGTWQPATVRGTLLPQGWGAALGFPGIVLDEQGPEVAGLLFSSDELGVNWEHLDESEGDGYDRVLTTVSLPGGTTAQAWAYVLRGLTAGFESR